MDKITISDFEKIEIRIGTVVEVVVPEWSHWVMKIVVDFGEELRTKVCFSGIMKFFTPEDLKGKQYPFVINMDPKKIGPEGDLSECMMIMAVEKDDEDTPPVMFNMEKAVPNGTKVR